MSPESQRYRLDSRIATGGMGEVWRATDLVLGREVAVKLLKAEYSGDPTFRSRFETEARNAAALHHPNVASVFDFGEMPAGDGGPPRPFLVMELVRGEPLSALLRGGERMPPATAADLLAQAADALAAAHDLGIVHRDVKPANLLVTPDRRMKITDFGIARAADAAALTQTGQVVGTPQYLSPEQAEGKPSTGASDIYSLGVVLYECLAGRRPFEGDSPIATALAHLRQPPPPLPADVPVALRRTVETALAKDPADRFASVRDMALALRGGPVVGGAGAGGATAAMAATRAVPPVVGGRAGPDEEPAGNQTRVIAAAPPVPPDGRGDSRGGRPLWPWVLGALAVLAVVLLLVWLSNRSASPTSGGTPSPSATASPTAASTTPSASPTRSATRSTAPSTVQVRSSDYVGRPAADARSDLEGLGLKVDQRNVANPGGKNQDTVAAVNPSGTVPTGSTVTLSVYDAPTPTPTPTPSPTATPTATGSGGVSPSVPGVTTPGGAKSKSKGNGKGAKH